MINGVAACVTKEYDVTSKHPSRKTQLQKQMEAKPMMWSTNPLMSLRTPNYDYKHSSGNALSVGVRVRTMALGYERRCEDRRVWRYEPVWLETTNAYNTKAADRISLSPRNRMRKSRSAMGESLAG